VVRIKENDDKIRDGYTIILMGMTFEPLDFSLNFDSHASKYHNSDARVPYRLTRKCISFSRESYQALTKRRKVFRVQESDIHRSTNFICICRHPYVNSS